MEESSLIYVLGIFECGCQYEAMTFLELVFCENKEQVDEIKDRFSLHPIDYQCTPVGCFDYLIFEGIIQEISTVIKKYTFDEYVKLWNRKRQELFRDLRERMKNNPEEYEKVKKIYDKMKAWKSKEWKKLLKEKEKEFERIKNV